MEEYVTMGWDGRMELDVYRMNDRCIYDMQFWLLE